MELNKENGKLTLIILIIANALVITSQSIVTTAVSHIVTDFSVSSATAQWVYSIFLLVLGVMIPLTAFITRRFKIKTILNFALIIFIIGSFISYLSPNFSILVIGRILEAIGTGILMPVPQILIFKILSQEKWSLYMGLFGFIVGIVPALGPTLGGMLTDTVGWRMIFLVFAIAAIIMLIISVICVKFSLETEKYPLDVISLILSIVGCSGVMVGFTNIAEHSFDLVYVILPIIIGIICIAVFANRQRFIRNPLINLKVLKNKLFIWGTLFAAILYFTMCGINIMMPLFVQSVAYYSSTMSGLILLPATVAMIIFNFVGPILSDKYGIKNILIISSLFSLIGFVTMMTYDINTSVAYMIITQIIRGVGAGLGLTPAISWTMSVVYKDVEDATAINNTLRQIVGAIGSSITVVIMQVFAGGELAHNITSVTSFGHTSLIMAILTVISLIVVVMFIKNKEDITNE